MLLSGSTPERTQQGYQALTSSDGVHSMPSDTALRYRNSIFCSQDARRGGSSFVRMGLLGAGTSTRRPQGCQAPVTGSGTGRRTSNPPLMLQGATPCSRDSSHIYLDARCEISTLFRRGGLGESAPTRSHQGYHANVAGGDNQSKEMSLRLLAQVAAPTSRHSRATYQDPRLAAGSLVRMGPLRAPTTPSSQQGCRTTLGRGGVYGG